MQEVGTNNNNKDIGLEVSILSGVANTGKTKKLSPDKEKGRRKRKEERKNGGVNGKQCCRKDS